MSLNVDASVLEGIGLTAPQKRAVPGNQSDEDTFMKLILTQLQNQDPTKPMDNSQFLSQLAQFKSVSGIDELKKSVDAMAESFQSNQALQASSLVGRWVMIESNSGQLWDKVGMAGAVDVPSSSSKVTVSVKDSSGQIIKQIDLGPQEKGVVSFNWDGMDDEGNSYKVGKYFIEANANIAGKTQALITNTVVPVESVIMGKVGTGLTVNTSGFGKVSLSNVKQIM